jgi:NifU-like protein
MEALQAAIADYRGEAVEDADDEHEGRIVCHCFGVTDTKIRNVAKTNNLKTAAEITNYCKAGGGCGVCLDDIQDILDGLWQEQSDDFSTSDGAFASLSIVQKVIQVQEVIDKEIKPILEQDGGSIELMDVDGYVIKVRLKGRCATCPSALVTLEHTVAEKLREFIAPELSVERV